MLILARVPFNKNENGQQKFDLHKTNRSFSQKVNLSLSKGTHWLTFGSLGKVHRHLNEQTWNER